MDIFPDWRTPLRKAVNGGIDYIIVEFGDYFEQFSAVLLKLLLGIEQVLRNSPPWVILVCTAAIAWLVSRRWTFAVTALLGLWVIGALNQWDRAMQTLALVLVSVMLSVGIGLPLGIVCARSKRLQRIISPLLDLMQTIPSFVYLIPAAMLFGLGKVPAILATVIYAAPPLIRLTALGIREVNQEAVEAGRAFGATRWQLLHSVQLPLSLPSILQGLNQTTMMALAMVVISSMIGARGVGETVLQGLQRNDAGEGLVGGITIVILAIILDRILQTGGQRLQPHKKTKSS